MAIDAETTQGAQPVHWLADVDALTVPCERGESEKFTLDEKLVTCPGCLRLTGGEGESND